MLQVQMKRLVIRIFNNYNCYKNIVQHNSNEFLVQDVYGSLIRFTCSLIHLKVFNTGDSISTNILIA